MLLPMTGRSLHVDVPLSQMVMNRRPAGFIADEFIPITPVQKQSDMYFKFKHGEWARYEAGLTLRAPRTEPRKVHFSVASDTFFANNYALATDWAVEDEVNADAIWNWAESHSQFLMDRLMVDYEWRIAQFAVATSNVRTVTLVGCGWHNAGSPIYQQLMAYKEQFRRLTGMMPNTMLMPETVRQYLATNSQLSGILFGQSGGIPTAQNLAGLIGINRVLTPATQANTFGEVETINGSWSYTDIWGSDSIILAHTNTLPGRETDTWINAFRWVNPGLGQQFTVSRYPYDPKRKVYELHVEYYQGEKVVSPDLGLRIIVNSGAP
jgi:hypothetical protein